jgi:hypothetical protein
MAWHGMAWHGMARHGMAWYGMVWYGLARPAGEICHGVDAYIAAPQAKSKIHVNGGAGINSHLRQQDN